MRIPPINVKSVAAFSSLLFPICAPRVSLLIVLNPMLDVYDISEVGASGVDSFNQHAFKWDRRRSKRGGPNSLLHQISTSMFARELCLPVIKVLTQIFLDLSSALIVDAHLIQII